MLQINAEHFREIIIFQIWGKIDMSNGSELRETVLKVNESEKPSIVLLDFTSVQNIDSIGLGTLLSIFKTLKSLNVQMGLFALQTEAKALFEITQLGKIIPVFSERKVAIQHFEDKLK